MEVSSGVPQGSILGPVLFVIFIYDMPEITHSGIQIFADDAKIFKQVNKPEEAQELQEDINSLVEWAERWQMVFNIGKCEVMHIGKKNPSVDYFMNPTKLEIVTQEKDLGINIDSELKMKHHSEVQVKTADRILGLIGR